LFGWGINNAGGVGDNTTIAKSSPVQIGSSSWTSVDRGVYHNIAIRSDGLLFTWGFNGSGQLGDDTFDISKSSPVQIGSSSWIMAKGSHYGCLAIRSDGLLFAWGRNNFGQLGDLTTTLRQSPVQIGSSSWTFIDQWNNGDTSAAIRNDGMLFAWGLNSSGQVGDNTTENKSSPVQIGSSSWISVCAGSNMTMAIRNDDLLYAWGSNTNGQLGDGTVVGRSSPVQIGGSQKFSNVQLGVSHAIAIIKTP
jgi:alpha-tubulin suppressor-like RCC1 family protein